MCPIEQLRISRPIGAAVGHLGKAAARICIVLLGDLDAYLGSDGARRVVIVRKVLLYLTPSGALLLDFCLSHEFVIILLGGRPQM